jgi:hypothetical protein
MAEQCLWRHTSNIRAGLSAYYLLLNFLNFLSLVKRGELDISNPYNVSVPLNFIFSSADAAKGGYQLLLHQSPFIKVLLQNNGIDQSQLESLWATWIQINNRWLLQSGFLVYQVPNVNLPSDIRSGSFEV